MKLYVHGNDLYFIRHGTRSKTIECEEVELTDKLKRMLIGKWTELDMLNTWYPQDLKLICLDQPFTMSHPDYDESVYLQQEKYTFLKRMQCGCPKDISCESEFHYFLKGTKICKEGYEHVYYVSLIE